MNPLKKPNNFEEQLKKQLDASEWKPSDALWGKIEQHIQANSFEPQLQEKLSDYVVQPSDEVWGKVASQLPESRKKYRLLWFGGMLLLILFSFGLGYFNKQVSLEEKIIPQLNSEYTSELTLSTTKGRKSKSKMPGKKLNDIEKNKMLSQELVQPVLLNKKKINSSHQGNSANSNAFIPIENKANKIVETKKALVVMPASSIIERKPSLLDSNNQQEPLNLRPEVNVVAAIAPNKEVKLPLPEPKEIISSNSILPPISDSTAGEKVFRGETYMEPEESFTQFSITVVGGVHLSEMFLTKPASNRYQLDQSYALRNEIEQPALDFSGAFLFDYHFGKSWMLSAGVGITSFSQRINFNVITANQSNPNRVQPVNLYTHATDSIIVGEGNSLESKYSFTEIPIQLSYLFKSDRKVQFALTAGLSYGRLNLVNAYLTDPNCIGLLLADDKDAFPKFKDVFFASFSPSLSVRMNSSASIGLMPQFKMALHSMIDNPDWIQQRPALVGLNVYLRKRF